VLVIFAKLLSLAQEPATKATQPRYGAVLLCEQPRKRMATRPVDCRVSCEPNPNRL